ncbi:MAG: helicase-related protein [Bacillota bacterium]
MGQNVQRAEEKGLRSHRWLLSYRTSSTIIDSRPVNMLHDFYLPVLRLAMRYDRVAGYFRSSSLAAASQGFSAFVGREGKMRLIVGADLEPEDVKAILAGDSQRLAEKLNGELDHLHSWPEGVRNGVTLLAWMVANGYLEVRVAFRIHRETGDPLPMDAVDDGYVHEKWFVLADEFNNRIYGAGTLNESKTALVLNAENIDVHCDWWGETDRRRVDDASGAFENLWMGQVPHMPVFTLPEAVRRRLIKMADGINRPLEVDGTDAAHGVVEPPSALERLRFAVLRDAPKMPGGRFVGMETAPVAPWPHQAVVAHRLIETWPYSYLLCDEVGLGKTIEAGLAFRSLYLSGLAKRILIAAPAGLTSQWQRQMASKMLMPFGLAHATPETGHDYIFPVEEHQTSSSIYEPDLAIVSTGLLTRRERTEALSSAEPFDIALVDEAHAVRRRNPRGGTESYPDYGQLYTTIHDHLRIKTRSLWLATATPLQIHPVEVCDLLSLTNRVGAFQFDPTLVQQYYDILGKLVNNLEPSKDEWEFLRRTVKALKNQDPLLWSFVEESIIDGRIRTTLRQWIEHGRIPRGRDRELLYRLLFSVSPLSRVMLRHNRRLLEIYQEHGQLEQNLAKRHILPMPRVIFTPLERRIYDDLEGYCEGLSKQIRTHRDPQAKQMVSFLLSFLRLRFASSLFALRETIKRRLYKVETTIRHQLVMETEETEAGISSLQYSVYESEDEDDRIATEFLLKNRTLRDLNWERGRLRSMLDNMTDITGTSSKMLELLKTLDQRRDRQTRRIYQTVIFTRFYDTLKDIVARLRQVDQQMMIGTYSGQGADYYDPKSARMTPVDREEVKERFLRGEIDVLLCTDAAAEGLNLQTADLLINFDLGWNPMKIEQRIGRIDRIGQKHKDIYVLNLCYADSAEEVVYGRLLSRLAEANMIVGTQQVSLLPVEPEDFQQLVEGKVTPEALEARALERIETQRRRTESMEINPRELFDIYMRMAQTDAQCPIPVSISSIWEALSESCYLSDMGCVVSAEPDKKMISLSNIDGVPNGALLTVSRGIYEEGMDNGTLRLHFASYGDPYFEAILKHFNAFELPECVQRVTAPVAGRDGINAVGYVAVCQGNGAAREVRLIRSWNDLKNLHLLEEESLTEEEINSVRDELEQITREEHASCLAASRIELGNLRAAKAQEMLNYLVIHSLLLSRARFSGEGALFWPVYREVAAMFEDRDQIYVPDLPAEALRPCTEELLFACEVPTMGDIANMSVPHILAHTAMDAAIRLADSMKVRKSDLRVDTVLSRLRREAESRRKQI